MADALRLTAGETRALDGLAQFPLVAALLGRRSRRFALGDEIPDGPLAHRSRHDPVPLSELELLVERHRGRLRRLSERRLHLPPQEPYMEGHNTWP